MRPDISIVCSHLDPESHITKPPVLIVEILSESTHLKDRNTKFNLYEFCGVKYYLMADPDNQSAEIYELIDNKYKQIFAPFHFSLAENNTIEFDLKSAIEY